MTQSTRRTVLKSATLGAAALAMGTRAKAAAADKVVIAIIGTGGMGMNHVRTLSARSDVEIAAVCDVDSERLAGAAEHVASTLGARPKAVKDLREVLDDPRIDAVWVATPDHWHTPAAILGLDAGKHVYVEKPCCHNIREGRLLADAVARSGKLLQVGTQSRSTECVQEVIRRVHSGEIGEVLVAKAWNSQRRGNIGKTQPGEPPANLDYDMWCGPAPMVPYRSNLLPGIWRWWYDFGCGDIGNDGVHDIDVAVWGLGVTTHPERVACLGGKYYFDDDQQFPDTQYSVCEYAADGSPDGRKKQLIFEQRDWSPYTQEGYENGIAFYGKEGCVVMGHTVGWKLYGPRNKLMAEGSGQADLVAHHTNFLDCVRGTQSKLNADVQAGFQSATIVHLSNIAARTGAVLHFDPQTERITNHEHAAALVGRKYRSGHWAVPREA
ncbi:MAG: Gfo/Idh/MocA family oxidoreductase [Planctomycetaceae bacterium]|nr:Gfo/Idh/MocA family oxidoreductase [Planctomycetaceae bacterium]